MTYALAITLAILGCLGSLADGQTVITFDAAETGKPMPCYKDQGIEFVPAHPPTKSRAAGKVMFFPHLKTPRKGILNAMANESIPVEVRFPKPMASVTLVLWGSIGSEAIVEAYDAAGKVADRTSRDRVPERIGPEHPIPGFELTVKAPAIAFVTPRQAGRSATTTSSRRSSSPTRPTPTSSCITTTTATSTPKSSRRPSA